MEFIIIHSLVSIGFFSLCGFIHKMSYGRYLKRKGYQRKKGYYYDKFIFDPIKFIFKHLLLLIPAVNLGVSAARLIDMHTGKNGSDISFIEYLQSLFEKEKDRNKLEPIEEKRNDNSQTLNRSILRLIPSRKPIVKGYEELSNEEKLVFLRDALNEMIKKQDKPIEIEVKKDEEYQMRLNK